jgi:hypothetical protein
MPGATCTDRNIAPPPSWQEQQDNIKAALSGKRSRKPHPWGAVPLDLSRWLDDEDDFDE